ncbi:nuclease HARBI1 [Trichonephila inaurata madagascariensis]|uniref:Nuclease HARBI1 n=1 Tax=Trichonephila inaurata madagascariensis TaxID=2747483 RepID=A0A8X7CFK8_9ARAC|nr:nuclease HARBI1 [Trichonephila inaurata madagascariensis]
MDQVLIALRFYAVACMQLAIAYLFDVIQPTVCRVVHRVSEAIASLLPDFIHLPVNREECKTVSRKSFNIAGFPKVIGALDGTFVRIVSPGGEDAERFRCRKNYFALNVQTIVDADLVIRKVVARWPGSAHDSTVFNNSSACLSLKTNELYKDCHLLGDTGYACKKYLLIPFRNPRSLAEARLKPCFSDNSSESDIESSIGEDTPNKPAKMQEKKIRFAPLPLPASTRATRGGRQFVYQCVISV